MRSDLTQYGVEEARTPEDVDQLLGPKSGTVLMVVNSICGCAAGRARPAIGLALQHPVRPSKVATVFAGGDEAAVAHLRFERAADLGLGVELRGNGRRIGWNSESYLEALERDLQEALDHSHEPSHAEAP